MKAQLQWLEPPPPDLPGSRRLVDFAISFGVSAVVGLAIAEKSGPTTRVMLGGGNDLSLPSQPWQYGVWLLACLAFGSFGAWIMSLGGRAQVLMREDGIQR